MPRQHAGRRLHAQSGRFVAGCRGGPRYRRHRRARPGRPARRRSRQRGRTRRRLADRLRQLSSPTSALRRATCSPVWRRWCPSRWSEPRHRRTRCRRRRRPGFVCTCGKVTVEDLHGVWDKGFQDLELVKRASLCGVGTCQGGVCMPHLRSFVADRSGVEPKPFTGRPAARQVTLAEAAAGYHIDTFRRTPLHDEHEALGANARQVRRMVPPLELRRPGGRVLGGARGRVARRREHARQDDRHGSRRRSRRSSGCTRTTCTTSRSGGRATSST